MSQDSAASSSVALPEAAQQGTVGSALRALRTAKGMSLEDVSARLKFSQRQIQALEDERWDALPGGVSLRGMIRNYARLLGTDPDAIVASFEGRVHEAASSRPSVRELSTRRLVGSPGGEEDRPSSGSLGWILVILIVVAAGVAYAFWQGWLPREWLSLQWLAQRFQR